MRQATVPSNSVGVAMNSVSVLKPRTVGSRAVDRQSHERGDGEPACRPISMLSFLEAENIRLRQAVVELSRDTTALRQALRKNDTDRKSTRLNSSHQIISYAVFCLKKKKTQ